MRTRYHRAGGRHRRRLRRAHAHRAPVPRSARVGADPVPAERGRDGARALHAGCHPRARHRRGAREPLQPGAGRRPRRSSTSCFGALGTLLGAMWTWRFRERTGSRSPGPSWPTRSSSRRICRSCSPRCGVGACPSSGIGSGLRVAARVLGGVVDRRHRRSRRRIRSRLAACRGTAAARPRRLLAHGRTPGFALMQRPRGSGDRVSRMARGADGARYGGPWPEDGRRTAHSHRQVDCAASAGAVCGTAPPVPSASSTSRSEVIAEKCVRCGLCVSECGSGGHVVRDDTDLVRGLLASGRPVVAVLATEFVAALYPMSASEIEARLEGLGFYAVESTLLGEELVALAYEGRHARDTGRPGASAPPARCVSEWVRTLPARARRGRSFPWSRRTWRRRDSSRRCTRPGRPSSTSAPATPARTSGATRSSRAPWTRSSTSSSSNGCSTARPARGRGGRRSTAATTVRSRSRSCRSRTASRARRSRRAT